MKDYKEISVREKSACELVEQCNESANVHVHLDPTLLLNSKEWDIVRKKNVSKQKYILVYTVMGQYHLFDYAKRLSKETGLPIIYLNDKMMKRDHDMTYKIAVSPEEFVGYFAEADYVVTNSFHGTAFSIIYHKNFVVEIEAVGRRNIRSEELLEKLMITDRTITKDSEIQKEIHVDWAKIDQELEKHRNASKDYLLSIHEK